MKVQCHEGGKSLVKQQLWLCDCDQGVTSLVAGGLLSSYCRMMRIFQPWDSYHMFFFLPCQLHGLRCALFSVGTEALWSSTQPTVTVPPSRSLCKLGRFSSRYGKLKWVIWHCQCWIANLLLLRVLQNLQNQREVSWYCLDVCLPDLGQLSSLTLSCFIIEVRVNRLFF